MSDDPPLAEVALYAPVKKFLEGLGYSVKGEVRGCDVVAMREGEKPLVVICELKLGLSLELVLQAVERTTLADAVWIAVVATRRGRDRDRRAHRLCQLLGLGLLAVTARKGHVGLGHVEILVEPGPYRPRKNLRKAGLIAREFARRRGDPTPGGRNRQKIMTAYRQQALVCAAALRAGPLRPRDLKEIAPEAGAILRANHYGWFERVSVGVYRLTEAGLSAVPDLEDASAGSEERASAAPEAKPARIATRPKDGRAGSGRARDLAKGANA